MAAARRGGGQQTVALGTRLGTLKGIRKEEVRNSERGK